MNTKRVVILNLTPHDITVCDAEGKVLKTFKSDGVVRLNTETIFVTEIENVPVTRTKFGQAEGLPAYSMECTCNHCGRIYPRVMDACYCGCSSFEIIETYYIVSQIVKNAFPDRKDLLVPAEMLRSAEGTIIGCQSLGI